MRPLQNITFILKHWHTYALSLKLLLFSLKCWTWLWCRNTWNNKKNTIFMMFKIWIFNVSKKIHKKDACCIYKTCLNCTHFKYCENWYFSEQALNALRSRWAWQMKEWNGRKTDSFSLPWKETTSYSCA